MAVVSQHVTSVQPQFATNVSKMLTEKSKMSILRELKEKNVLFISGTMTVVQIKPDDAFHPEALRSEHVHKSQTLTCMCLFCRLFD